MLAVSADGVGGVGMILVPTNSGGFTVKRISKHGPAAQNGMVNGECFP